MTDLKGGAPLKYPYLVTSASWATTETSAEGNGISDPLANFLEDVDMDGPDDTVDDVKYVVLDTNILMNHLHLVRQFYSILNNASQTSHFILIPSTVINELDKLKLSLEPAGVTPDGDVTTGDLAKAATRWLLDINRIKKEVGHGAIRLQKWSEHLDKTLVKGDDKILDCCLFFGARGSVTLWTNDQNLLLLADSNDVTTLRGYTSIRLEHIMRSLDIPFDKQDITSLRQSHSSTAILHVDNDEDGMELDDEYISTSDPMPSFSPSPSSRPLDSFSTPTKGPISARWTFGTTPTSSAFATAPSTNSTNIKRLGTTISTPRPTTRLPAPLLLRLSTILSSALTIIRPDTTPNHDLPRLLKTLIDLLLELEKKTSRPSDINMNVLQSIGALRTISTFVQDGFSGKRRPRIGEVADAVDLLATTFRDLGVFDTEDELRLLATDIRALP